MQYLIMNGLFFYQENLTNVVLQIETGFEI